MSDEKLVKEFIEKMQPQNKACFVVNESGLTVLHEYAYCQCDMIKSFEAGLKAEREKSKKLVDKLKEIRRTLENDTGRQCEYLVFEPYKNTRKKVSHERKHFNI